ncbi:hypothetical protein [Aquimarina sp. SS2-1]|uniref:hypothetical protein n=1 Tax=Aquimarina besae TaxID=3342247 RepID=UPI00366EB36F
MKLVRKSKLIVGAIIFASMVSCSEDDNPLNPLAGCVYQEEAEASAMASQVWSQNPTPENCQAAKQAAIVYLRALEDCPLLSSEDLEDLREDLQSTIELDCSDGGGN